MRKSLLLSAVLFSAPAAARSGRLIFLRVSESPQAKSTCSIFSDRVELTVKDKLSARTFQKKTTENQTWTGLIQDAQKNTLLKSKRAPENTNTAYLAYTHTSTLTEKAKEVYLRGSKGRDVLLNSSRSTVQIIEAIDSECVF